MKIAIPTSGSDLQSNIASQFGRAENILIVDPETLEFEVIENAKNLHAPQGAGIQAAQKVYETGAEWLLTGHCGPKAFRVLSEAGIKVAVGIVGTIADAVERCNSGGFQATDAADVESHWA